MNEDIPICDAPICDSHVHVVAGIDRHEQVAGRSYTAAPAPVEALRAAAAPEDVGRFVVVQPSFYGTDNTVTLEAVAALGQAGRAVAVIDPARTGEGELRALSAGGVAGLRLNLYSPLGGGGLAERFEATAAVAARQNWHVQVIAPVAILVENAHLLAASPVPVVIDHFGLPGSAGPGDETGKALLRLLSLPHVWCKLSAPYRSGDDPLATRPDPGWLTAILSVAASRCVWGSDWPHTAPHELQKGKDVVLPYRALRYAEVLGHLRAALPPGHEAAVLRHNPARLYGFDPA